MEVPSPQESKLMLDRVDRLQSKVEDSALSLWSSTDRLRRLVSDGADADDIIDAYQAFSDDVGAYLESLETVYRYLRQRGLAGDYDPNKLFVDVTGVEGETQKQVVEGLQSLFEGFDIGSVVDTARDHVGSAYEEARRLRDLEAAASSVVDSSYESFDEVLSEVFAVLESNAEEIGKISTVFVRGVEELDEKVDGFVRRLEAAKDQGGRQLLLSGIAVGGSFCGGVAYHEVITSYMQYLVPLIESRVDGVFSSIMVSAATTVFVTFPLVMYFVHRDVSRLEELERRAEQVRGRRRHFIALTKSVLDVAVDLREEGAS